MPPLTAISPPVGTYALIFYSHWGNALHWGLVLTPRRKRMLSLQKHHLHPIPLRPYGEMYNHIIT